MTTMVMMTMVMMTMVMMTMVMMTMVMMTIVMISGQMLAMLVAVGAVVKVVVVAKVAAVEDQMATVCTDSNATGRATAVASDPPTNARTFKASAPHG
jgi:hypothetical protein